MLDLYLRGDTRETIDAALLSASLIDEEGCPTSPLVCIDRIGTISRVTGYDGMTPIVEVLPGYHVNCRLLFDPTPEQLADLDAVTIRPPDTPFRVWAS